MHRGSKHTAHRLHFRNLPFARSCICSCCYWQDDLSYISSLIIFRYFGNNLIAPLWNPAALQNIRLFFCALLRLPTDPKSIHNPEFFGKYLSFLEGLLSKVSWKFTKTRVFPGKLEFFQGNLSFFRTWVFFKMHKKGPVYIRCWWRVKKNTI